MKSLVFASRNGKEMLRDPLNLSFGIGFPVVLLLLLSAIQANIPASAQFDMFKASSLTPGIAVFGLSFISLFSGMLISKDRSTSFFMRLYATPMNASDFILGYTLPLIPMSLLQCAICFAVAFFLGLPVTVNILLALVVLIPAAVVYIGFGLLAGSLLNDKQVGGICGALLTNVSAWLSGTWFDLNLVGGTFKKIADLLPFDHAVNAARAAVSGDYASIFPDLWWVIGYAAVILAIAVIVFRGQMNVDR